MVNLLITQPPTIFSTFYKSYLHYYVNKTIFTTKFDDIFLNIINRILNVQEMSDVKTEGVFHVSILVEYVFSL